MDEGNQFVDDTLKKLQNELNAMDDFDELNEDNIDIVGDLEKQLLGDDQFQVKGLPPIRLIVTMVATDSMLAQSVVEKNKKYHAELIERKKKFISAVKEGKLTAEKYIQMLEKIDPQDIMNQLLQKQVQKEKLLAKKFPSLEVFFEKVFGNFEKLLQEQIDAFTVKKQVVKQVVAPPKVISPQEQQQIVKQRVDGLPVDKKLQNMIKAAFKLQSQLDYLIEHLPATHNKTRSKQLLIKLKQAKELILKLQKKIDTPIGYFIVSFPKITFESFHQISKKEYLLSVQNMIGKIKAAIKIEQQFSKKCSLNAPEVEEESPSDYSRKLVEAYEEYLEFLNSLKTKQYCPLPSLKSATHQRNTYIQNSNLSKNQLHIRILHVEGAQNNTKISLFIPEQQNDKIFSETVNNGDQNVIFPIKLKDQLAKQMTKLQIILKLSKKHFFSTAQLGDMKLNTKDLQYKNYVEGVVTNDKVKIKYSLSSRVPRSKAMQLKIEEFKMTKVQEYVFSSRSETEYVRKYIKNYIPPKAPRQITLFYVERTADLITKLKSISVEGLKTDQILYPQSYSSSIDYIEQMNKVIIKSLNTPFTLKENKPILENMQNIMLKIMMTIKAEMQIKKISKEDYLNHLKTSINQDLLLKDAYQKAGLADLALFIQKRSNIIIDQIQQLKFEIKVEQDKQDEIDEKKRKDQEQFRLLQQALAEDSDEQELDESGKQQPKKEEGEDKEKEDQQESSESKPVENEQKKLFNLQQDAKLSEEPDDIKHPWLPQYCKCLTYIQNMIEIASSEQLKQIFSDDKDKFMQGFESGEITPQSYAESLNTMIEADKKRLEVYLSKDIALYAKFITARIKIMQEQLQNL